MRASRHRFVLIATIAYTVFAVTWILLSDQVLGMFVDRDIMLRFSTAKGLSFVLGSSIVFFLALRAVPPESNVTISTLHNIASALSPARQPRWLIYFFSVVLCLATFLARAAIGQFTPRPLLILFVLPIILSALLGGLGPGLVATLVATLGAAYLTIPPIGSFMVSTPIDFLQLSLLVLIGFAISAMSEWLRRSLAEAQADRRLLQAVISGTSDAIFVKDRAGRYVLINPAGADAIGKPVTDIIGTTDAGLFPEGVAAEIMAFDRERLSTGTTMTVEERIQNEHGSVLNFLATKGPISDEEGRIIGVFGISRDITERKKMEEELREAEERFRSFMDNSPFISWIKDEDGKYVFLNKAFRERFGLVDEEWIGRSCTENWPPEIAEKLRANDGAVLETWQPIEVAEETPAPDGSFIFWHTTKFPFRDAAGKRFVGGIGLDITARRKLEADKDYAEMRYHAMVEQASPDAIFVHGHDGRFIELNQRACDSVGYSRDELLQMNVTDLSPDFSMELAQAIWEGVVPNAPVLISANQRHKDGHTFPVEVGLGVFTVDGERLYVAAVRDVTARLQSEAGRAQAEAALREERRFLKTLVNALPDLVWAKDTDGTYLTCNARVESFFGVSETELVGKSDYDFLSAEIADAFRAHDLATLSSATPVTIEEEVTFADGHREILETVKTPILGECGKQVGVLGVGRDMTQRKKMENDLRVWANAFQFAEFDQAIVDPVRNVFVSVNPSFARRRGYRPAELTGEPISLVFPAERIEEALRLIDAADAHGHATYEIEHVCKDGRRFPVEVDVTTTKTEDGSSLSRLVFVQDISEQKQAELEKAKLQARLQQAQKLEAIGQLAGGVAHDFNNKLMVIMGCAELARMTIDDKEKVLQYLGDVTTAAEHSRQITMQLLGFSRQQVAIPQVVEVNFAIREAMKTLSRLIGEHISIEFRPKEHLGAVKIDPVQLDQVIMNMAVNARDAMPTGGVFTIATGHVELRHDESRERVGVGPGEYVTITFSDNGVGMDQETQKHIFEPYFTTKAQGKGTGLGLATIHGIVSQNGGMIEVSSAPGRGTVFTVYLPRHAAPPEQAVSGSEAHIASSGSILLVEDEAPLRKITTDFLRRIGYTVHEAETPGKALQIAGDRGVALDLVLTDVIMPEMNGIELAKRILESRPEIKTVFVSGYLSDHESLATVSQENTFVQKPYDLQKMSEILKKLIDPHPSDRHQMHGST